MSWRIFYSFQETFLSYQHINYILFPSVYEENVPSRSCLSFPNLKLEFRIVVELANILRSRTKKTKFLVHKNN